MTILTLFARPLNSLKDANKGINNKCVCVGGWIVYTLVSCHCHAVMIMLDLRYFEHFF